jgi:hypothetical protein
MKGRRTSRGRCCSLEKGRSRRGAICINGRGGDAALWLVLFNRGRGGGSEEQQAMHRLGHYI